jgi:hypothetical protein
LPLAIAVAPEAFAFEVTFTAVFVFGFLTALAFAAEASFFGADFFFEVDLIKLSFPIKTPLKLQMI